MFVRVALLGFSLAGLFVAWMLSFARLFGVLIPCGASSGCETVSESSAAVFLGIPIAYLGLIAYTLLSLVSWFYLLHGNRSLSRLGYAISIVGAVVSTGLTWYSITVIHAKCLWCLSSNGIMCVLAICFAATASSARTSEPSNRTTLVAIGTVLTLVAGFAIIRGSTFLMRGASYAVLDNAALRATPKTELMPSNALVINPSASDLTLVVFIDLLCPTCHLEVPKIIRLARGRNVRVFLLHNPQEVHRGSFDAAVLEQEATDRGQGALLLEDACDSDVHSVEALAKLKECVLGTDAEVEQAKRQVTRDMDLARRLGIVYDPAIIVIPKGKAAVGISLSDFDRQYFAQDGA